MSAATETVWEGRRVLVTSAHLYMGPSISARFRALGATVLADEGTYVDDPDEPARVVAEAGVVDVLVLNLAGGGGGRAADISEELWQSIFDRLVHPMRRFVTAVLPQMIEREAGKIVAVTSAAPLRAVPGLSAYASARGAQNAYVKSVGGEVARHNVQVNAIAQHFTIGGYAPDAMDDPDTAAMVRRNVPARRLATAEEQAELVVYLASEASGFFNGQVFPFTGGWVTT